jgi:glycosyltransferase involved in cell wall biosynthesis
MKLGIVIPALNEEDSIEKIILATYHGAEYIKANSPVNDIDIIVVSDGSTDRTVELAQKHLDKIKLIIFEKNRGYGAAIKQGWESTDADLLAFLDADGTCDPKFFANLCTELAAKNSDIVLGCRINKNSQMPLTRRFGNFLFATLLSMVSKTKVKDTASGMRVVRKSSLEKIMPLPDGLHFTPAMSARALLSEELIINEIDMPYKEREGQSKLKIWKDGIRFLSIILKMAFLYQPQRLLLLTSFVFLAFGAALMLEPILFYLQQQRVEEDMIYRFLVSTIFGLFFALLVAASYLTEKIVTITLSRNFDASPNRSALYRFFNSYGLWVISIGFFIAGTLLISDSLITRLKTGETNEHWSRYIVTVFLYAVSGIFIITKVIDAILGLVAERLGYLIAKLR